MIRVKKKTLEKILKSILLILSVAADIITIIGFFKG